MNITVKLTKWVEKKVGKLIREEVENNVAGEDSFDVEECAQRLLESTFFQDPDFNNIKNEFMDESLECQLDVESDDSNVTSQDSLDCEHYDFQTPSLEEISVNLQSALEEVQIRALEILEASPAEELIIQTSWTLTRKILQDMLRTCSMKTKIPLLVLKVFRRFLVSHDAPKIVCEGFITLTESICFQIELLNSGEDPVSMEEIYDFKENKWFPKDSIDVGCKQTEVQSPLSPRNDSSNVEVLIRSIWLLTEAQKAMPGMWVRFNERRLREIIFSFIHLLSSSLSFEEDKVSALEIVAVLSPSATWCHHWCHGAASRTLLCSALRRYKKFFSHVIEIILYNMRTTQVHYLKTQRRDFLPVQLLSRSPNNRTVRKRMLRSVSEDENANKIKDKTRKCLNRDQSFERAIPPLHSSKKHNQQSKLIHSAPSFSKQDKMPPISKPSSTKRRERRNARWIVSNIPREIVDQATFCHCFSLVACVVQFRAGRSLFPVSTASRKRQMMVQDLISSMITYAESLEPDDDPQTETVPSYKQHLRETAILLRAVESNMHPSRVNTQRAALSHR